MDTLIFEEWPMKKLILTVALLAVAGTASATAQGVYTSDEGSRKIVFWYDSKDGTIVYNFNISDHTGRPATKNGILYQSSNPQKPVAGNAYTFAQNSSYYEGKDKSRCLISASWNKKGVLTLAAGNSCSKNEKTVYTGRFNYTPNIVFPEKYRGAWAADCRKTEPGEWLRIGKTTFTQFQDFGAAKIVSTNNVDGMFVAAAAEISGGAGNRSFLMIRPEGRKLRVTGEHHAEQINMTVQKCSSKSGLQ